MNRINLVSPNGTRIGEIEKLEAHQKGILHEAFSIFIFNDRNELLLQQRAKSKYHSGGLWTNTCCSHAQVGEDVDEAVHRRLQEEMGFDCSLEKLFAFTYMTPVLGGLTEHEYDYVYRGYASDPVINVDPEEVEAYRWISLPDIKKEIECKPETYTEWLKILMKDPGLVEKLTSTEYE